jgi:hypothetical protein
MYVKRPSLESCEPVGDRGQGLTNLVKVIESFL